MDELCVPAALPIGGSKRLEPPTSTSNASKMTQSRNSHTLDKKLLFISTYEEFNKLIPDLTVSTFASHVDFKYPKSIATKIMRERENIVSYKDNTPGRMTLFRMFPRKLETVERAVYNAIMDDRALGVPVNDSRTKELAYYFYVRLLERQNDNTLPQGFGFSKGWLGNFKNIYQLTMKTGRGQLGDVDMEFHRPAFEAIAKQLTAYDPSDVYNCDETGLYLKVMPNRTLSIDRVSGRKPNRDARVSILLCCNATGTDKRKPLVLSAYRPLDLDLEVEAQLDTSYHGTGYMTTEIFLDWLGDLDADMGRQGRNIALLIDNAPGHGKKEETALLLNNITLVRLPKNTTSVSQPLDAGIIMSFKVKYGRLMIPVISHYRHLDDTPRAKIPRGPLWACLPQAWNRVSLSCIRNCFARVPVLPTAMQDYLKIAAMEITPDDELVNLKRELAELYPDRCQTINRQTDYGMLLFLKSMSRRGPTVHLEKYIDEIAIDLRYKSFFTPLPPMEELGDVSDDGLSDDEYLPPVTAPQEPIPPAQRVMDRRSGQYISEPPADTPSSQEPASSQEAPPQRTPVFPPVDTSQSSSGKKKESLPRIPADDMLTELRHYSTTHRKHHSDLQVKEMKYLASLEKRVMADIEVMTDYLKLHAIND